jgi:enoyl-[acyl-carrier protein] reductase II
MAEGGAPGGAGRNRLCAMLGIEHPILLAGMGGIAGKELVAAVSSAGGLGTWGSALDVKNKGPDELLAEVKEISRLCGGRPFGVDILVHGSDGGVMKQLIDIFADGGAKLFVSGKGYPRASTIKLFHDRGMLVASIAGKTSHAVKAVEAGVDFVIVQGYEAGGHTGEVALSVLLPEVVDAVAGRVPVVAAGGIYDGRGVASALLYGAEGVWVGTRFMMTREANVHPLYHERLLRATSDDTVVTKVYTGARMRALKNPYIARFDAEPGLLEADAAKVAARAWNDGCWKLHSGDAESARNDDVQAFVAGQNIGAIDSVVGAADVVRQMVLQSRAVLGALSARVLSADRSRFRSKLCEMLGVEYPIMLAGMGGIASKELVAAVSNAGGFGTWGSAVDVKNKGPEELLAEVKEISRLCGGRPFGVDILVHGGDGGVMKQLIDIFADGGARAFISGKGFPKPQTIKLFHDRGMLVASIAGRLDHAVKAVEAGVDFVIVQGYEAGGHTGEVALGVLLPQVVDAVGHRVPVVAAGGICDGRGVASALAYGASGVWVGTRFMMTPEAQTHQKYKERLLQASSDDTTVTKAFTGARLRVLRNPYTDKFEHNPALLEADSAKVAARAWNDGCWKLHSGDASSYDDSVQAYVVGQNIGRITQITPAADVVRSMVDEAVEIVLAAKHHGAGLAPVAASKI